MGVKGRGVISRPLRSRAQRMRREYRFLILGKGFPVFCCCHRSYKSYMSERSYNSIPAVLFSLPSQTGCEGGQIVQGSAICRNLFPHTLICLSLRYLPKRA